VVAKRRTASRPRSGLLKNARQKTSKRGYVLTVGVITQEFLLAIAATAAHSRQLLAGAKDTDDVIDPHQNGRQASRSKESRWTPSSRNHEPPTTA
jgi:hypothetical protein